MALPVVTLNDWVFDGATVDDDGLVYSYSSIKGWWDTANMALSTDPRGADDGVVVVDERLNERAVVLSGFIHHPTPGDPIGDLAHAGLRRLKAFCRPLRSLVLLTVDEPAVVSPVEAELTLQALVRLGSPISATHRYSGGVLVTTEFQIPLLAPDPRRYSTVLHSLSDTDPQVNGGDELTPPTFIFSGVTDPEVRSHSVAGDPILKWFGTVGGGSELRINCAEKTVTLDGVNARAGLLFPNWFQYVPGDNDIEFFQASGVEFRDAYS